MVNAVYDIQIRSSLGSGIERTFLNDFAIGRLPLRACVTGAVYARAIGLRPLYLNTCFPNALRQSIVIHIIIINVIT